ncbi:IS66 family insertion sequence element accessory protein TnpB [Piscirickettsia litoralis]|uniref:IS66 family insertion sequence element accessory protein TnpB n=1 Tax=Piscirickettsia litoralis TaxID=1891921 RepID=UPI001F1F61E7|nr:IS66 family insertion sequence element accessory protein TnpB [Piscirickettsia litoralis]
MSLDLILMYLMVPFLSFFNRKKDKLKYLYSDGTGFCLLYKRLEKGCFKFPKLNDAYYLMSEAQLSLLLDGVNWYEIKKKTKEKYSKLF